MTYTAEDFKNAMFAALPKYGLRAHKSAGESYWQRDGIKRATNAEMAEAGWRPVHESAPLTLDTLREAWENAEVPTVDSPIRKGDAVIYPVSGGYTVFPSPVDRFEGGDSDVRVHQRTPQREPWQDLADMLGGVMLLDGVKHERVNGIAQFLHERGVRVKGGEES